MWMTVFVYHINHTQKRLTIVSHMIIWTIQNSVQVRAHKKYLYGQQNIYLADK